MIVSRGLGIGYMKKQIEREMKEVTMMGVALSVRERHSTAHLVVHARHKIKREDKVRPWTTVEYSFNGANGKQYFNVGTGQRHSLEPEGTFEGLLPIDMNLSPKDVDRALKIVSKSSKDGNQFDIFFKNLHYIINQLEGSIWWNGFKIELIGDPKERLELIAYQMDPFCLAFLVSAHKKIEILRTFNRLELIAQPLKSGKEPKLFWIEGHNISKIEIVNPKDGTLILKFPPYSV